jgi:hypothetical protein
MHALDERLQAATRELHDVLDTAQLRPASTVKQRHQRRRHARTALAAIVAVATVAGLGALVTRDVEPTEPGSPTSDPTAERLLFPAGVADTDIHSLYLGPDLTTSAKGLVQSPDGELFSISIGERGGWQETPNVERRDINDRTFTVEAINSELAYVSLDECAVIGVSQIDSNGKAWDANASVLLSALTIVGRAGNVALPPGWRSFGVGSGGHLIQLAYTARLGTAEYAVVLMQAPDSNAAVISRVAQATGPLTSATFNGQQAWTVGDTANSTVSLIWQDGPNAALLSGQASLEELKQIANSLKHDHADEWAGLLPTAENLSGTVGTTPGPTTTSANSCGTPTLTVTPASTAPASAIPTTG